MKSLNKILYKIVTIIVLLIIMVSYGIPGIISPIVSLAANDANDYDFRDELESDRVGIGFTWSASNKTLTITGIKNKNAEIKLPRNSIIDIQGSSENIVKYIYCAGELTIKGNDIATLNIVDCYQYKSDETELIYYSAGIYIANGGEAGIYISGTFLKIDSGNINISLKSRSGILDYYDYGIKADRIMINNGKLNITIPTTIVEEANGIKGLITINGGVVTVDSYGCALNNTGYSTATMNPVLQINGGTVTATSTAEEAIIGSVELNGGTLTATTKNVRSSLTWAFKEVPSVNPNYDWKILYNKEAYQLENATETDITEIYNVYKSKAIKIEQLIPTTAISLTSEKDEITVGEKLSLIAKVEPQNTTDAVVWSSSDGTIATISQKGEITALAPGKVTITATSGEYTASKELNVRGKVTLNPNGVEGIGTQELYTDINGKLTELPNLPNVGNQYFDKWVDSEGNEITLDTIYKENTTIYAQWITREISIGEQKTSLRYGEASSTTYEVTSNFLGAYTINIENLPEGITLESNQINFIETEEGIYKAIIKLNVSNTIQAGVIQNLKVVVNDTIISNNFTLTIEKAVANYESPTAKTIVYTGNEEELITPGSTTDGQMQYSLDGTNFASEIPTATNAGTYTVYYKVIGDKNHQDSTINHITAVINKANSYIETAPKGNYFLSYNGQEQELVQAGKAVGGTIEYSLDGENFKAEIPKAQNVGGYTIYYRVRGDANHNSAMEVQEECATIHKVEATIEVLPTSKDLIYNGEAQELIYPGVTKDGVLEYSLSAVTGTYSTEIPTVTNIGDYNVYYRVVGDSNHYDTEGMVIGTIKPKKAEVELRNKSLQYNGQEQELVSLVRAEGVYSIHYSLDDSLYIDDTIPTAKDAGIYTIYYQVTGAPNYENSGIKTITSVINPAESKFTKLPTAPTQTLVYTGDYKELIIPGKTEDGVIEYSLDGTNFSMRIPSAWEAGTYNVYYRIVGDRNHTNTSIQQLQVTIQKAKIEIDELPKANSLTYANGQEQELVKQGSIWGGDFVYSLDRRNYSKEIPKATEPGNYKIYYKIEEWENWEKIEEEFYIEVTLEEDPSLIKKELPFTDVKKSDWFYGAVEYVYNNNMIRGVNETTFDPNSNLTRGMLVTILHRMEGSPYVAGVSKFSDVQNSNDYYYVAVKWATQNNIVSGYNDGSFGPNDNITREQLAVILNKYCRYKGKYKPQKNILSQFKDTKKISEFAYWEMQWATGTGVITGSNGNLNPQGTATRAEAASMLYKYCLNIK